MDRFVVFGIFTTGDKLIFTVTFGRNGGRYNSHSARGLNTNSLNSNLSSEKILIEGLPLWLKRGGPPYKNSIYSANETMVPSTIPPVH